MKQLNAQINSLRKQAEQAETYKTISEEITQLEGMVMYLKWYNLKDSFERSDEDLKNSEQSIQKFTLQVSQAANDQAKASDKIQPLRENEIEAAARLNRINLERESLDREEERIKEVKTNLEQSIQQIISDLEREQFQINVASKDLEALNARKTETDIDHEIGQIDNEQIEKLKVEKDQLESRIDELEKDIEKYNSIKSSKRDEWQKTVISEENLKSRQSTLKEVEGYDFVKEFVDDMVTYWDDNLTKLFRKKIHHNIFLT